MKAFVMSGGGNRGSLQAGALLELLRAGIKPDLLVGTSAGALNACFLAVDPTLNGAEKLADIWRHARKEDFFPGGWFSMIGRLASGHSLFTNEALRQFAEKQIPQEKRAFGDLHDIKLYITAANLNTGRLYLWGDDPNASIIDAAIASAAHPLAYPPVKSGAWQLVDGGVVANVPVGIAVDKGATEIYILNVGYAGELVEERDHILEVLNRALAIMSYQPFLMDLKRASLRDDVTLHHISMTQNQGSQLWDLDNGAQMVEMGQQAALEYLANPTGLAGINFAVSPLEADEVAPPPGAQEYVPSWLR